MTWRTRLLTETPSNDASANGNAAGFVAGTPTSPPLNRLPLISDVVALFGMATGATAATQTTPVQTDPFVFQMAFNPATLKAEGATNADMATHGNLYLASFMQLTGQGQATWQNAITGDFAFAGSTTTTYNGQLINIGSSTLASMPNGINRPFIGTFAQWEAQFDSDGSNLQNFVGVWGVEPDTLGSNDYNAWAIINHNSIFAVVPEPSAIVLAAFGLIGCVIVVRRRKNQAAV